MQSPGMLHPPTIFREDGIDQNTTLCLACSCSLPPLKKSVSQSGTLAQIFLTPCCRRPICPACITANPRLQRYNHCLACLSGVGLVRSSSATSAREKASISNVDGAVRDEDAFIVGDADDGDEDDPLAEELPEHGSSGPRVIEQSEPSHTVVPLLENGITDSPTLTTEQPTNSDAAPPKYYITRNDTLQGIALRYGLNVSIVLSISLCFSPNP
jgi:LysM repeat protein